MFRIKRLNQVGGLWSATAMPPMHQSPPHKPRSVVDCTCLGLKLCSLDAAFFYVHPQNKYVVIQFGISLRMIKP